MLIRPIVILKPKFSGGGYPRSLYGGPPQLRPHNSPVWFGILAHNGEGFIKTLHISITPRDFGVSYASYGLMSSQIRI